MLCLYCNPAQAVANEWDEQERRKREQEQMDTSLYRSRLHGSGLTEDEQEERDFRTQFPQFNKVYTVLLQCKRPLLGCLLQPSITLRMILRALTVPGPKMESSFLKLDQAVSIASFFLFFWSIFVAPRMAILWFHSNNL